MDKNKSEELKNYIVNNYDINNANDVANALKDMFGGVIQSMMNAEFDSSMGYEKRDNKISKTIYRNCSYNKKVKSQFGEFDLEVPRDRNSVKFVSYKHLKEFSNDLRRVYKSNTEKEARENLEKVKEKWKGIYPTSLKVWDDNWEAVCTLFNYSKELRRIMYTTNAIESLNRSYRKYTKTKVVFPNDISLMKCLYLATKNIEKKMTICFLLFDLLFLLVIRFHQFFLPVLVLLFFL